MNGNILALFITTLLSISTIITQAQNEKVDFVDAVLDEPNNTIEVIYNLKPNSDNRPYTVTLYYSNDGGKTFKGPAERVSGDVGIQVQPGSYKKIYWNYFYEDKEFTGENLVFSIRAKPMTVSTGSQLMGPKAALYSVLIPGWGDTKARMGKNYWLITAGTWGLMGAALVSRSGAKNSYDDYLNATDPEAANSAFDDADGKFNTFKTLRTLAILAWAADVVGVYIRGKKNEKEGLVIRRKVVMDWNLTMSADGRTPLAGLKATF
ncbi:hypothetical protein FNH22_29365 [Fulvivirga sp. M361]|uniref:hypothetical protein n=1 Tax=Fulvivirga sp. M361 TaxID=2594266 RepID=UPI00117AE523|nr:hypothetical protein [Fulvivirga sp. M361]TRX48285.1 hypothetical protein FNH22_29365 [Fulvivirga sp. M361]